VLISAGMTCTVVIKEEGEAWNRDRIKRAHHS
jgi:hypothetical protein